MPCFTGCDMQLSEDEEHAIAVEVWLEYQSRRDRAKALIYTACVLVLVGVLIGCAVPLSTMAGCKHDCSLASGLLTGVVLSSVLLVLTVCICCMECFIGEEEEETTFDRNAIIRAITEKRERHILLKERRVMNEI